MKQFPPSSSSVIVVDIKHHCQMTECSLTWLILAWKWCELVAWFLQSLSEFICMI